LRKPKKDSAELRAEYIARLQQQTDEMPDQRTLGSLWIPGAPLGDFGSDYKARNINDNITIRIALATVAAQSGSVTSQRTYAGQSAITGLPGRINTKGVDPLFNGSSSSALKGQGQTAANSTLTTNLNGQVIAVLPSGNLVVEAQRLVVMNNQRDTVIVRGVVRPGDIGFDNSVPSTALGNLEIEMKGKGIISDSTRPLNPITKAVMWLFGF
jgi:flagellar L-ring protein precursor FlgH